MRGDWLRGLPWLSLAMLGAVGICAAGGDFLLPSDPGDLDLGAAFEPPAWLAGGWLDLAEVSEFNPRRSRRRSTA